jgi:superfamily II DNA or RNA helicase
VIACFFDERRLLYGPWQALERDTARALIYGGFDEVRIVGGVNDKGADVLGTQGQSVWVVQCKYTNASPPPKDAVEEVVEAGRFYRANRMMVVTSRQAGSGLLNEIARHERIGVPVDYMGPRELLELARQLPEYAPARRPLRDYQQAAADKLRDSLIETGRGQIVLATGLGKTIIMAEVVADLYRDGLIPGGRVLVLADQRELVRQLEQAFWLQLPKWIATHQLTGDELPAYWEGITFATVQSVVTRLDSLPSFGLVLVDEAHHLGSATYQAVLGVLKPQMLAGVTATPWRGDGYEIDDVLGQPLVQFGIADGLKRGFLCDVDYRLLADNVKWDVVQNLSRHSYSVAQLNKQLILPTRDGEAAREIARVFRSEQRQCGLVFCPTVEHAVSFAAELRPLGLRSEGISAALSPRERDQLMTAFKRGNLDILTTVDLFNEGVDVPSVDLIVFMRATHSRRIFVQQVGRGLRIAPNKDKVVILDFVTDLRRIAEVIELEKAASGGPLERLPLGGQIVQFRDQSAGGFMREWMKDQADLLLREGDASLELPRFEFPVTPLYGGPN